MHFNWKQILAVAEAVEDVFAKTGVEVHGVNGDDLKHITQTALTTAKTVVDAAKDIKATVKPTPPAA